MVLVQMAARKRRIYSGTPRPRIHYEFGEDWVGLRLRVRARLQGGEAIRVFKESTGRDPLKDGAVVFLALHVAKALDAQQRGDYSDEFLNPHNRSVPHQPKVGHPALVPKLQQ